MAAGKKLKENKIVLIAGAHAAMLAAALLCRTFYYLLF